MKLYIKHMVSERCKIVVREELKKMGLHFIVIGLGEIEIMEVLTFEQRQHLKSTLLLTGLELMDYKSAELTEKIKSLIIEMIHNAKELPKINFSAYISEKLHYDYNYLSNLFSKLQGISIQQFILINRIERAKELLMDGELNLTRISYKLQYSSVAHLSNQFKQITGLSPRNFMSLKDRIRIPIEDLGNSNVRHFALAG